MCNLYHKYIIFPFVKEVTKRKFVKDKRVINKNFENLCVVIVNSVHKNVHTWLETGFAWHSQRSLYFVTFSTPFCHLCSAVFKKFKNICETI